MSAPVYALVAYVRSPIGRFVEDLRRDLHPEIPELPAHVTVLPPRNLLGTEEEARQQIQEICRTVKPFEIVMGDVETFAPTTPTVFIRVAHAAYRMRDLHDRLNVGALQYAEPWPYMPHLTIVKLPTEEAARQAAELSRQRWASFGHSRRILIEEVTFVREGNETHSWVDLASLPLGSRAVAAKK
jgi:2'-5' RNA ligase